MSKNIENIVRPLFFREVQLPEKVRDEMFKRYQNRECFESFSDLGVSKTDFMDAICTFFFNEEIDECEKWRGGITIYSHRFVRHFLGVLFPFILVRKSKVAERHDDGRFGALEFETVNEFTLLLKFGSKRLVAPLDYVKKSWIYSGFCSLSTIIFLPLFALKVLARWVCNLLLYRCGDNNLVEIFNQGFYVYDMLYFKFNDNE